MESYSNRAHEPVIGAATEIGGEYLTSSSTSSSSESPHEWPASDGAVDRLWKGKTKEPLATIFVHAGAGFHSIPNEKVHLSACSEAARIAMKLLQSGCSAVDAVEAAIKYLEEKEITNAGYGSNLNINGHVECDATIVDHYGRSGACGAVPNIKHPISLARMILESSGRPLSLRRVPPNLLVGTGAKEFAQEHGIAVLPNASLISKNSQDRFRRWTEDLNKADGKVVLGTTSPAPQIESSPPILGDKEQTGTSYRRDHAAAISAGTWNEGQPDSPQRSVSSPGNSSSPASIRSRTSAQSKDCESCLNQCPMGSIVKRTSYSKDGPSGSKRPRIQVLSSAVDGVDSCSPEYEIQMDEVLAKMADHDGQRDMDTSAAEPDGEDKVTDTVGAIAIDIHGKIACGASSGGIGMKHAGRVGPAALVGVGTAVVPLDPDDDDGTCVAAVTSGTGEHMATSMASSKCAERLYYNQRRGHGGTNITDYNEDALMESFVEKDFMGHPGVKNQCSIGAIGAMAVKKTKNGHYFCFAHNTESFALASMASNEKEPLCVMSRLGENRATARGGRKIGT